jgi:hypothetical protein
VDVALDKVLWGEGAELIELGTVLQRLCEPKLHSDRQVLIVDDVGTNGNGSADDRSYDATERTNVLLGTNAGLKVGSALDLTDDSGLEVARSGLLGGLRIIVEVLDLRPCGRRSNAYDECSNDRPHLNSGWLADVISMSIGDPKGLDGVSTAETKHMFERREPGRSLALKVGYPAQPGEKMNG